MHNNKWPCLIFSMWSGYVIFWWKSSYRTRFGEIVRPKYSYSAKQIFKYYIDDGRCWPERTSTFLVVSKSTLRSWSFEMPALWRRGLIIPHSAHFKEPNLEKSSFDLKPIASFSSISALLGLATQGRWTRSAQRLRVSHWLQECLDDHSLCHLL